jgi:head-tail adaptor
MQKAVWAGTRLNSFGAAAESMAELAECSLSAKQVRRITTHVGEDRVAERCEQLDAFIDQSLMERTSPKPNVKPPEVGVLMLDNGMHQRRDHFGEPGKQSHWKQETAGLALSMTSEEHQHDPCPEFPEWLHGSDVVREIANLAKHRETPEKPEPVAADDEDDSPLDTDGKTGFAWTPKLASREVIASTEGTAIARHLEWVAWEHGITAAKRQAFVADGASSIWKIHKRYFSQMTGRAALPMC